jgi:hypothetical protein
MKSAQSPLFPALLIIAVAFATFLLGLELIKLTIESIHRLATLVDKLTPASLTLATACISATAISQYCWMVRS